MLSGHSRPVLARKFRLEPMSSIQCSILRWRAHGVTCRRRRVGKLRCFIVVALCAASSFNRVGGPLCGNSRGCIVRDDEPRVDTIDCDATHVHGTCSGNVFAVRKQRNRTSDREDATSMRTQSRDEDGQSSSPAPWFVSAPSPPPEQEPPSARGIDGALLGAAVGGATGAASFSRVGGGAATVGAAVGAVGGMFAGRGLASQPEQATALIGSAVIGALAHGALRRPAQEPNRGPQSCAEAPCNGPAMPPRQNASGYGRFVVDSDPVPPVAGGAAGAYDDGLGRHGSRTNVEQDRTNVMPPSPSDGATTSGIRGREAVAQRGARVAAELEQESSDVAARGRSALTRLQHRLQQARVLSAWELETSSAQAISGAAERMKDVTSYLRTMQAAASEGIEGGGDTWLSRKFFGRRAQQETQELFVGDAAQQQEPVSLDVETELNATADDDSITNNDVDCAPPDTAENENQTVTFESEIEGNATADRKPPT